MRLLYCIAHYLLVPVVLVRLLLRATRNRAYLSRVGERFGLGEPLPDDRPVIWLHAVSVGEVQASVPLVRALRDRVPGVRVLLTTTTPTGYDRAMLALGDDVTHRYTPYDLPGSVHRFLNRVHPALLIVMETELWPNVLHACEQRGVLVVLANVRLSARSALGYSRWPGLVAPMLRSAGAIAVQTREDGERLLALGAPPERVVVTGSMKFDLRVPASVREEGEVLRRCFGVERGVWVAASTHEGEEEQVLDAFSQVLSRHTDALLVLVPRHPERFARVAALCRKRGFSTVTRSKSPESCADVDVYVGDSMGELLVYYAAADVAFVGGSLVPVGGHNLLEPAALGLPVVTGPHLFNFTEIGRRLTEIGAATQVSTVRELGRAVSELLDDGNRRHAAGEAGRVFVENNRGALQRLLALLSPFLPGGGDRAVDGAESRIGSDGRGTDCL